MSRSFGRIQRALLDALERRTMADTFTLATDAYDIQPDLDGVHRVTDEQLVATRRALANLAKAGCVFDLGRGKSITGQRLWCNQKEGLYQALLLKKVQISNDPIFNGNRLYTPAEVENLKTLKDELITVAKNVGAWPYIRAKWRKRA